MPLYLVRWPGLVASLVNAVDENDLLDRLDETGNPEGCTWTEYEGPLCIDFELNATFEIDEPDGPRQRPLSPDQVRIGDVSRICKRDLVTASIPADSDTAHEMVDAILLHAFPMLDDVVDTDREKLPASEVRDALRAELDTLIKASWQHEQTKRRPDRDSRVAAIMGTSPKLVAHWTTQVAGAEARARETPPKKPKKPTGPKRKQPKKPGRK